MDDVFGTMIGAFLQMLFSNPLLILILLGALFVSVFKAKIKGRIGEGVVNLAAKGRLDSSKYKLLYDVTIPKKGGTTQIDHIVLSRFGIFVIETKNYSGWIYGNAKQRKWTQVCYKKKNSFQNPLHQNNGHIRALMALLGVPKEVFHNVVCFIGDATFKTAVPEGVFLGGRYVSYIQSFNNPVFSDVQVEAIKTALETGRMPRGLITDIKHVQHLKKQPTTTTQDASVVCEESAPVERSIDHDKLAAGLAKYCRIQEMFNQVDVSKSREFQKVFNGYYRIRRNAEWQSHFYELLQRSKYDNLQFADVLHILHQKTGNVEASFSSKLIATRHPDRPVIDRFVFENLGLKLPSSKNPDRMGKIARLYDELIHKYEQLLQDPAHFNSVKELRRRHPQAEFISDVKALDLIFWQTRQ